MSHKMTQDEIYSFLREAPRTGHLATVRGDDRPHVAPLWIAVDGEDIVFTTDETSVKGKNLGHTKYASLTVDDDTPPFSFVTLEGPVTLDEDPEGLRHWATVLGGRYMGEDRAEELGKLNSVKGQLVCRLTPTHLTGVADLAG